MKSAAYWVSMRSWPAIALEDSGRIRRSRIRRCSSPTDVVLVLRVSNLFFKIVYTHIWSAPVMVNFPPKIAGSISICFLPYA